MEFTHEDPGARLRITGRIASADLPDARQAGLFALELGTGDLVVDLMGASVADVNALGLLLEIHHRAERAGRRLLLANVPPELDRLLRRTRLGRVLHRCEVAPSVPDRPGLTHTAPAHTAPAHPVPAHPVPAQPGSAQSPRAPARRGRRAAPALPENQPA